MLIGLYFISITINRKGVVIITTRDIVTRGIIFICHLWAYLLGSLEFPAGSGALIHATKNPLLFLKGFQLTFPIILGLLELLKISIPVTKVTPQTLFQGLLVGTISKAYLRYMRNVLALRYSRLLVQHIVALGTTIVGGLLDGITVWKNSSRQLIFGLGP